MKPQYYNVITVGHFVPYVGLSVDEMMNNFYFYLRGQYPAAIVIFTGTADL